MKPIKFKEHNCVYAENQEAYEPLPAYKHNDVWGTVTSCWRLSFLERIKVLFTGRIYMSLLCFGGPLTPQFLDTSNPVITGNSLEEDTEQEEDTE